MSFSLDAATQLIVGTITEESLHHGSMIPEWPIALIMNIFQKVRFGLRYIRFGNIYKNQANFLSLSSGHLLNMTYGENQYIRRVAQCVLIANLLSEGIEQQKKVYRSYVKLISILEYRYPRWNQMEGIATTNQAVGNFRLFSPSSIKQIKATFYGCKIFITMLAYRIYRLSIEIFRLCVLIADTVDSVSLSSSTSSLAVCHLFFNLSQQLNYLASNGPELIERIQQNSHLIDKLFSKMGAPYSAATLLTGLRPLVQTGPNANAGIVNISRATNETLWQMMQEGIFGFMAATGFSSLLPDSLVPPLLVAPQANCRQAKSQSRYPALQLLRWRPQEPASNSN